ncbi:MAG: Glucose-6-phosphate dehydrogenase subunit [Planctomycetota bacterium]|nr:Glucose-6-phosphate dehydrogenase subunit [Planctomycetota bacterium]
MADTTTTDAFLSGQGIPVDLTKIETALAALWGPAAEREGGPDLEHPSVTRVTLANLLVMDLGETPPKTDDVLDTVVARYPCRAIVVRRDDSLGRKVSAEISALCHLPAPGMPQVCSERILLKAGREGFDLIPGAVRPLLEADLPLVLWWMGDPRVALPLFRELSGEANRAVLDLPDPSDDPEEVLAALDLSVNPFGRDLAWFGITRWRELTAQFFDPVGEESILDGIRSVTIVAEAARAGSPPRVSAWFAAWLAGQLGWTPKSIVKVAPVKAVATFVGARGEITVTILTEPEAGAVPAYLSSVSITATNREGSDTSFHLVRLVDQVSVEVSCPGHCQLPRMVQAAEFTVPDRVSAALESAREDPPYRKALPNMIWLLFGGAPS